MQLRRSEKTKANGKTKASDKFRRSGRFLQTEDGWYFRTREGILVGPYPSEFDCELGASLLTARLAQLEPDADPTITIRDFLTDPVSGPRSHQRVDPRSAGDVDLHAIKAAHKAAARRERMHGFVSRIKASLLKERKLPGQSAPTKRRSASRA